jgi:crotonobetainyl-CoA:carnitine CoA-transferase CaiB-like acyl-CoA transferase
MFERLRVLELASVLAGPSVGQFFAELGAEVIKVENTLTDGDVTRTWKLKDEKTDDRSTYFCAVNWGKKSIGIDLTSKAGKAIVYELVQQSDIVIASYKSGDAEKLGVDYNSLAAVNANLIYGQITGFGSNSQRVGYDAVVQAESGFMYMNGKPGGESLKMPVALMDILAAHHLKEGLLIALLKKQQTGKGDFVEVSLLDAAISSLANQASNWLNGGIVPQKQGSAHHNIAPYGDVFTTADGNEILLAVGTDSQFKSLCTILGANEPDLLFKTNELRVKNRTALYGWLSDRISVVSLPTLVDGLLVFNVPYGIVKNVKEVFDSEGQALLLRSPDRIGVKTYVGSNLTGNLTHFLPPPNFGEHSRTILSNLLKKSSAEIDSLISSSIIR